MRKYKTTLVMLLAFLLLPLSFAFAQEEYDYEYDYDVTTLQEEAEDMQYELYDTLDQEDVEDMVTTSMETTEELPEGGIFAVIAGMGILFLFPLAVSLGSYIFFSLALAKIGKDLGYKNSWFAWIPLLNTIMMMQLGEKPWWWILVPFAGQIMMIIAIMRITERRGYDKLLGLLILTGIGGYVLLYLLAWSPKTGMPNNTVAAQSTGEQTMTPPPVQPSLEEQIAQAGAATMEQPPVETPQSQPMTPPEQPTPTPGQPTTPPQM